MGMEVAHNLHDISLEDIPEKLDELEVLALGPGLLLSSQDQTTDLTFFFENSATNKPLSQSSSVFT